MQFSKKRAKKAKYLKIWAKIYKIWKYFLKRQVIVSNIAHNKLPEKALSSEKKVGKNFKYCSILGPLLWAKNRAWASHTSKFSAFLEITKRDISSKYHKFWMLIYDFLLISSWNWTVLCNLTTHLDLYSSLILK